MLLLLQMLVISKRQMLTSCALDMLQSKGVEFIQHLNPQQSSSIHREISISTDFFQFYFLSWINFSNFVLVPRTCTPSCSTFSRTFSALGISFNSSLKNLKQPTSYISLSLSLSHHSSDSKIVSQQTKPNKNKNKNQKQNQVFGSSFLFTNKPKKKK